MELGQVLQKHGEGEVSYGSFHRHNEVTAILSTLCWEASCRGVWHAVRGASGNTSIRTLEIRWPLRCACSHPLPFTRCMMGPTLLLHTSFPAKGSGCHPLAGVRCQILSRQLALDILREQTVELLGAPT